MVGELKAHFAAERVDEEKGAERVAAYDEEESEDGNVRLLQLDEYRSVKSIVVRYHSLFLDDDDAAFDALLIECTDLVLEVPDDVLGIEATEFLQHRQVAAVEDGGDGKAHCVYIADKESGGRFHRIYFFSRFLSVRRHPVHVQLEDVSPSLYRMGSVAEDNEHLVFLDVAIPWTVLQLPTSLKMSFHYRTDKGMFAGGRPSFCLFLCVDGHPLCA